MKMSYLDIRPPGFSNLSVRVGTMSTNCTIFHSLSFPLWSRHCFDLTNIRCTRLAIVSLKAGGQKMRLLQPPTLTTAQAKHVTDSLHGLDTRKIKHWVFFLHNNNDNLNTLGRLTSWCWSLFCRPTSLSTVKTNKKEGGSIDWSCSLTGCHSKAVMAFNKGCCLWY